MSKPVLIFDWGDTLMRVFPDQQGPMMEWPRVEEVPGAGLTLAKLAAGYRLLVATNAGASTSAQVRLALARAGLDDFFEMVLTPHELGAIKADPAFYRGIASLLSAPPDQLTMLGDAYATDILSARRAGLKTVWFNPARVSAPASLPLHDREFASWEQLDGLLSLPALPSYDQCLTWIMNQPVSAMLLSHVHLVAAAAYRLAVWMRARKQPVDVLLVHRGALLHDLAKLSAQKSSGSRNSSHPAMAAQLLRGWEQPALAEIAARHALFSLTSSKPPRTIEERLVYFADKLAEGSRLVEVQERLNSLMTRYPHDQERIAAMTPALAELQAEIAHLCGISSVELVPALRRLLQTF